MIIFFKSSNSISENLDIPKYILKKVAETKINKEIVYRKKQAFPLPLNKWMKKELGDYFMDNLSRKNSMLADLINVKTIKNKLLKKDFDNSEDLDGKKYWMLLNLDKWLNDFPRSSN